MARTSAATLYIFDKTDYENHVNEVTQEVDVGAADGPMATTTSFAESDDAWMLTIPTLTGGVNGQTLVAVIEDDAGNWGPPFHMYTANMSAFSHAPEGGATGEILIYMQFVHPNSGTGQSFGQGWLAQELYGIDNMEITGTKFIYNWIARMPTGFVIPRKEDVDSMKFKLVNTTGLGAYLGNESNELAINRGWSFVGADWTYPVEERTEEAALEDAEGAVQCPAWAKWLIHDIGWGVLTDDIILPSADYRIWVSANTEYHRYPPSTGLGSGTGDNYIFLEDLVTNFKIQGKLSGTESDGRTYENDFSDMLTNMSVDLFKPGDVVFDVGTQEAFVDNDNIVISGYIVNG